MRAAWGGGEDQVRRRYSISSTGTRGRPFDRKKPPGTRRVVILGGSAVFDIFAEEGKDWPHRVEHILRRRGHARIELINGDVSGHASFDSLGRLYTLIWTYEPDIVLL